MPNPRWRNWRTISLAALPPPASSSRNAFAKIADPAGEGRRAFIHVDKEAAIEAADAMDHLRKAQRAIAVCRHSRLDQGSVRHQGPGDARRLPALEDSAPAEADAPVVARCAGPALS